MSITKNGGTGRLYLLLVLFTIFASMSYLSISGYINSASVQFQAAIIFFLMASIVFLIDAALPSISILDMFPKTLGGCGITFILGSSIAVLLSFLGTITGSVTTFSISKIMTTATQQLPHDWSLFVNIVGASHAEELFFFSAIFFTVLIVQATLPSKYSFLKSGVMSVILYGLVSVPLFFWFHVSQAGNIAFFIAITIFRLGASSIAILDYKADVFKKVFIGLPFLIGWHMTNNALSLGLIASGILFTTTAGLLIFGIYVINIALAVSWVKGRFK